MERAEEENLLVGAQNSEWVSLNQASKRKRSHRLELDTYGAANSQEAVYYTCQAKEGPETDNSTPCLRAEFEICMAL